MINKNYIIIGVIILVVVAGVVFWSRNSSLTPDALSLQHGTKNLTRESAAKMIETFLKVNPQGNLLLLFGGKTKSYNYDQKLGHYALRDTFTGGAEIQILKKLESAGFVKIVSEKRLGQEIYDSTFDFTDKATPYFVKREGVSPDDKNVDVLLAELVSVEVTGLTEPMAANGVSARIANFTATYKATPIGAIIDEKTASAEFKSQMPFVLYDDGWRVGIGQ